MAPTKSSRTAQDDKDAKDKGANSNGKMRRIASQQAAREHTASTTHNTTTQEPVSIQWHTVDRKFLHAYRRENNLDTPSSFAESYHHYVFSRPGGIGLQSPTMARRNRQQRQTKEQLALAVRKHFNSVGVQENDVIVDLIHAVHNQGVKRKPRLIEKP
ncbi:hypothetical protein VUR80DRAFT_6179 [Thermomyces stellatus]